MFALQTPLAAQTGTFTRLHAAHILVFYLTNEELAASNRPGDGWRLKRSNLDESYLTLRSMYNTAMRLLPEITAIPIAVHCVSNYHDAGKKNIQHRLNLNFHQSVAITSAPKFARMYTADNPNFGTYVVAQQMIHSPDEGTSRYRILPFDKIDLQHPVQRHLSLTLMGGECNFSADSWQFGCHWSAFVDVVMFFSLSQTLEEVLLYMPYECIFNVYCDLLTTASREQIQRLKERYTLESIREVFGRPNLFSTLVIQSDFSDSRAIVSISR